MTKKTHYEVRDSQGGRLFTARNVTEAREYFWPRMRSHDHIVRVTVEDVPLKPRAKRGGR